MKWKNVAEAKKAMYKAAMEPMDPGTHVRLETDGVHVILRWIMFSLPVGVLTMKHYDYRPAVWDIPLDGEFDRWEVGRK